MSHVCNQNQTNFTHLKFKSREIWLIQNLFCQFRSVLKFSSEHGSITALCKFSKRLDSRNGCYGLTRFREFRTDISHMQHPPDFLIHARCADSSDVFFQGQLWRGLWATRCHGIVCLVTPSILLHVWSRTENVSRLQGGVKLWHS